MSFILSLYLSNFIYLLYALYYKNGPNSTYLRAFNLSHYGYGFTLNYIGRVKMSNKAKHWEKTRGLLFITLAIWFVFSIGIFFFGTEMEASSFRPFGYPLSYYMTCQGSLLAFVILNFWFAGRQEKIDEEFGFTEREDS